MTSTIWILWQLAVIPLFLEVIGGSFPENSPAITVTSVHDVPSSFFTGGDDTNEQLQYVQELKMVKIAGNEYFAISGRENLFLVAPEEFSPFASKKISHAKVYTWKTNENAKNLCVLKGQSNENCENYIRVVEQVDEYENKLLICGTNSYDPKCRYLSAWMEGQNLVLNASDELMPGTDKCPFGPDQTGASLFAGNSLYSATASDFKGRSYTITRSLSDKPLRTPKFDTKFLKEPHFVKMVDDGERVLVFMNEMVKTANGDVSMVAYVAQVCKNDVGGQHVLIRQWTKFVKTRLNCSRNGFYFNQLQDVSDPVDVKLSTFSDKTTKTIYASFTTPDHSVPGSAVCAFTLDSIHEALLGKFREERGKSGKKSDSPSGAAHPGNCPNQKYSNSELLFLKSNPLLEDQAKGKLLNTYVGERWTSVAVDTTAGPERNWTVYFVGTEQGQVLRYLSPSGGLKNSVLLKRQDVYDSSRCGNRSTVSDKAVKSIFVDPENDQILATFKHCVIAVPLRACSVHKCKTSCLESADPYCGWNGTKCINFVTKSVNVMQSVFLKALNPKTNVEDLCVGVLDPNNEDGLVKLPQSGVVKKTDKPDDKNDEDTYTNGSFVEEGDSDGTDGDALPVDSSSIKLGDLSWGIIGGMLAAAAILFFIAGICFTKLCCGVSKKENDVEKQHEGMEMSKASLANNKDSLCKKFIASISPKRKRKGSMKPPSLSQSETTITDTQQGEPLVSKQDNKLDEYVKHHELSNGQYVNINNTLTLPEDKRKSRLNSASTVSQVTVEESVVSSSSKRRGSAQPTSSVSSMGNRARPNIYSTAPRIRHTSGNRTSDPSDYTNAPTLRADKPNGRIAARHSTPVPVTGYPSTPTSVNSIHFAFEQVVENTEHVLDGVKEVIEQQQRRSTEMETLLEEPIDEARLRHESSDSGKGSSPRNSVQTEEQDKVSTLNRNRPENLQLGMPPQRGRKRLNSEPTSPTGSQPPLPPSSAHNPVGRSISMRSQHALSVPSYPSRKRSESFTSHHSQQMVPMANGSPMKMQQMTQNGFVPQARPNMYSTLPLKPGMVNANNGKPHPDPFLRQIPYDAYSHAYPGFMDQRDHPAMNMPDRYSSLPLRSQAHRSNKKPYPPQQYQPMQQVQMRRNSGTPQVPQYLKQMSTPATFDQHTRPTRGKYVPPPSAPVIPSPLPEQDAV